MVIAKAKHKLGGKDHRCGCRWVPHGNSELCVDRWRRRGHLPRTYLRKNSSWLSWSSVRPVSRTQGPNTTEKSIWEGTEVFWVICGLEATQSLLACGLREMGRLVHEAQDGTCFRRVTQGAILRIHWKGLGGRGRSRKSSAGAFLMCWVVNKAGVDKEWGWKWQMG